MTRWRAHLLVESQGPWAGPGCARFLTDAAELAQRGRPTRMLLLQDGVLAAVPGAGTPGAGTPLEALLQAGGELWLDRFSWVQRGLPDPGALPTAPWTDRFAGHWADLDDVAAQVLDPAVQVVWH